MAERSHSHTESLPGSSDRVNEGGTYMGIDGSRRRGRADETVAVDTPGTTDTAGDRPLPRNQRTTFLAVLGQVLVETYPRFRVVQRPGTADGPACLVVTNPEAAVAEPGPGEPAGVHATEEICCDLTPDGWVFAWAGWSDEPQAIGPVEDLAGAARSIAAVLGIRHM